MESKIKLSGLKGNDKNPRLIKKENAEQLKKSIVNLGDLSCIVYNERTGKLVGGHQRKEVILKLIGSDPEVTITNEYKKPNEVGTTKEGYITVNNENYKVRFVDFSEKEEALAILIANDKRNQGEYDFGLLPTVIDIANDSNLSVEFDMLDFVESLNIEIPDFGNGEEEEVSFTAKKGGEIDTDDFDGEALLEFRLSASEYQRVIKKLNETKMEKQFTSNEDALIFLLF